MKKLTKFLRPIATCLTIILLAGCAGADLETVNDKHLSSWQNMQLEIPYPTYFATAITVGTMGNPTPSIGEYSLNCHSHIHNYDSGVIFRVNTPLYDMPLRIVGYGFGSSNDRAVAMREAVDACEGANPNRHCIAILANNEDLCDIELPKLEERMQSVNRGREQRIANQGNAQRQNQCRAFGFTNNTPEMANCLLELYKIENQPQQNTVITNPSPSTSNSQDLYQSLELLNRGIELINGPAPTSNIPTSVSCRRMGDRSGQVYTFSRIGCPIGYAPAL